MPIVKFVIAFIPNSATRNVLHHCRWFFYQNEDQFQGVLNLKSFRVVQLCIAYIHGKHSVQRYFSHFYLLKVTILLFNIVKIMFIVSDFLLFNSSTQSMTIWVTIFDNGICSYSQVKLQLWTLKCSVCSIPRFDFGYLKSLLNRIWTSTTINLIDYDYIGHWMHPWKNCILMTINVTKILMINILLLLYSRMYQRSSVPFSKTQ